MATCADDLARCRSISTIAADPIGDRKFELKNSAWGVGSHGMIDISSWDEGLRVAQRRPFLPTAYFNGGGLQPYCHAGEGCAGVNPSAGLRTPVNIQPAFFGNAVNPNDVFPPFSGVKFGSPNSTSGWDRAPGSSKLPWTAIADKTASCTKPGPAGSGICNNPYDPSFGDCNNHYSPWATKADGETCFCPPRR